MPLVCGLGVSYSPLLYRPRERWPAVRNHLVGTTVQPASAAAETPDVLDAYEQRLRQAFGRAHAYLAAANVDALIVLGSDHGRAFDASNTPQLHAFAGTTIWGDAARPELDEPPVRTELRCNEELAVFLAEELVMAGFDLAEARGAFRPLGDPVRGLDPSLLESVTRLAGPDAPPLIPIHVNCHVAPCVNAHRLAPFGRAIARALALVPQRVGILASGGLSGDPGGAMAGWVDPVLDRWVLGRLQTGRAEETARLFDIESLTLRGATQEIRLWTVLGAALEAVGRRAAVVEYLPFHHAAVGTAVAIWEE